MGPIGVSDSGMSPSFSTISPIEILMSLDFQKSSLNFFALEFCSGATTITELLMIYNDIFSLTNYNIYILCISCHFIKLINTDLEIINR